MKLRSTKNYRNYCHMCRLFKTALENQTYDYADGRASFWIQRISGNGQQVFSVVDARTLGDFIQEGRGMVLEKNAMLTLHVFKYNGTECCVFFVFKSG